MLTLVVNFEVRAGAEEKAKEFMRALQEHTRREPGCRSYIGNQSKENPRRFCFYEMYDSQAALDVHRAAPYFAQYVVNGIAHLIEKRTEELFAPVE
jgi:quinol monooxygenase YgiN